MSRTLAGTVAIVTGGGRGFGREIALGLSAAGASVVVAARSRDEIAQTASMITTAGGRALAVPCDVTSREDVERLRPAAEAAFGAVNLVVHNAGTPLPFGPAWEVDPDEWWDAQAVHVRASMYLIHTFVPRMLTDGGGRFILVSSLSGVRVGPNSSGYNVAKSTQIRVAQHLAAEGADRGVYAFAVHPGGAVTGLADLTINDPAAQKYKPDLVASLASKRAANVDDSAVFGACADMCVALSSGQFDELSGLFLRPDDDLAAMRAAGGEVEGHSLGVR